MKITRELKFHMQLMSFMGIAAAMYLIHIGLHTIFAYAGLGVNVAGLLNWIFIEETDENKKDPK